MLTSIADGLWTLERPQRFFGLPTGTRMTVARLQSGGLFVHSPVHLDKALYQAIADIGPVEAVIAPCKFHHLYIGEWAEAFPEAAVVGCPGLAEKRPDVPWNGVLGDQAPTVWKGQIDQVFFGAYSMVNEVVFFHRASRTMISSDVLFNLSTHSSGFTRTMARLMGNREPGTTPLERWAIRDRKGAREQIDRMLAWKPETIVLAHGDCVTHDGKKVLERAYAWL